jgi:hypothetical protein
MGDKRITIGGSSWKLLPTGDVDDTLKQIRQALDAGTVTRLELLDVDTGNAVSVYLNGGVTDTVSIDLGGDARPSEIFGSVAQVPGRGIVVGGSSWKLPAGDVTETLKELDRAVTTGSVAQLQLVDDATGNTVTVYVNGRVAGTVSIDLGGGPRPSEIFGS